MKGKLAAFALAAATLSGCAFGQKFSYADSKIDVGAVSPDRTVALAVLDQREYVKNGKKPESFIGISRGGFGNPFDVETRSGAPMATEMATALAAALKGRGAQVQVVTVKPGPGVEVARSDLARAGADRLLLFILNEWKTDSMARTGLDFDVGLEVMDRGGKNLARASLVGKEVSDSSVGSAEKDAQGWFATKASELLRAESVTAAVK